MSLHEQLSGQTVHIGADCGVQFADGRDLFMRVSHVELANWAGMAWVTGYVLDPDITEATGIRQVYVIADGLRLLPDPDPICVVPTINLRQESALARIPRQRTKATTGSIR